MRTSVKILILVLILVVAAVASVPLWVDAVARSGVEVGAREALGVPVQLAGIDIGLFRADCSLQGLEVANPEGYKDANFMRLEKGFLSVSASSLLSDKVVVPELTLDGLELNLERKTLKSNYGTILDNLKRMEKEETPADEGRKFVIERVVIRNIKVTSRFSVAGIARPPVPLEIPEMTFQNLGSEGGSGIVMAEVVGEVLKSVLVAVSRIGKGVLPDVITDGLGKGLGGLGDVGKLGIKVAGKGVGLAGKVAGGVVKGIGGLLGGKKKPKKGD